MSYRKIEVGGKEYEYTIGKRNVKIKGVGVYNRTDVGKPIPIDISWDPYCPMYELGGCAVKPSDISRLIKENVSNG